jgi:hypothetical protein
MLKVQPLLNNLSLTFKPSVKKNCFEDTG